MYNAETYDTLRKILNGIHPFTNEKLSSDDLIMHSTIQNAIMTALRMSWAQEYRYRMQWESLSSRKIWCDAADSVLLDLFKHGLPVNVLTVIFQRSEAAIRDRLKYHNIKPGTFPEYLFDDSNGYCLGDDDDDDDYDDD